MLKMLSSISTSYVNSRKNKIACVTVIRVTLADPGIATGANSFVLTYVFAPPPASGNPGSATELTGDCAR